MTPALVPDPRWNELRKLVVDSVSSAHSRRAYGFALDQFFAWYAAETRGPFSKAVVNEYRVQLEAGTLSASTINVRLAAVRKLAMEAADNGLLAPELAAGIARVHGAKRLGARAGNWLTPEEATAMLNAPDRSTLIGCRNRAMLALLIGCGLRRTELVSLDVESVQLRDSRWSDSGLGGEGKSCPHRPRSGLGEDDPRRVARARRHLKRCRLPPAQ